MAAALLNAPSTCPPAACRPTAHPAPQWPTLKRRCGMAMAACLCWLRRQSGCGIEWKEGEEVGCGGGEGRMMVGWCAHMHPRAWGHADTWRGFSSHAQSLSRPVAFLRSCVAECTLI